MNAKVARYQKPDGYRTRYWSVTVNDELLAVTLYRNGAEAVARTINTLAMNHEPNSSDSASPASAVPESMGDAKPIKVPVPTEPGSLATDSQAADQFPGISLPLLESEAARRKRRRKGLRSDILGEQPY